MKEFFGVHRGRPETKTRGQIVYLGWGVAMEGLVGTGKEAGRPGVGTAHGLAGVPQQ